MNIPSSIRKLPNNAVGKDYVIGDLHGCFDLLEQLLAHVNFNTRCDRLFSVGDLIDRGPHSLRCLGLLNEPWFYAVQGNHELMMINFFMPYLISGKLQTLDDIRGTGFLEYGGDWVKEYFQADRECMSDEFNNGLAMALDMPILLVVGTGASRFNVVHAELVTPDYRHSGQTVWLDNDIDRWVAGEEIAANTQDRFFWGRKLMRSTDYGPVQQGLATTFCGHTVAKNPRQVLSHLCIDTGAFISLDGYDPESSDYGLTLFDVKNAHWLKAAYGRTNVVIGSTIESR